MSTSGRYQLLDRIAQGGMAELFRARAIGEQGFSKLLAIKRILPQWADDALFVQMLVDEARMAALMAHPNIVQVHELGRDEQGYFIAMELVLGPNLAALLDRLIERGERLPRACALDVIIHLLHALDYAHAMTDTNGQPLNLVHRDVSPENVLLTAEGVVKLADFGVAKAKNRLVQTQVGALKGKLPYMSPEQVGSAQIDRRSDIFAAGLLLWECLAGRLRYDAQDDYELLKQVEENRGPTLREIGVEVEPELDAAIARALRTDPEERFQTAGEFARELTRQHRRLYPDYDPSVLGNFVGERFRPELDKFEQTLRRLQTGELSALGYAGAAAPPDAAPAPLPAAAPARQTRGRVTGEQRAAARPDTLPDEPKPLPRAQATEAQDDELDDAIGDAIGDDSGGRAKGVSIPVLAVSFVLAGAFGVGAVLFYESRLEPAQAASAPAAADAGTAAKPADAPGQENETRAEARPEARPEPRPDARPTRSNDAAATGGARAVQDGPKAADADAPPLLGLLDLYCEPDCEAYANNKRIGPTPLRHHPLPAGRHQLSLRNDFLGLRKNVTVEIVAGQTTARTVNLVRGR